MFIILHLLFYSNYTFPLPKGWYSPRQKYQSPSQFYIPQKRLPVSHHQKLNFSTDDLREKSLYLPLPLQKYSAWFWVLLTHTVDRGGCFLSCYQTAVLDDNISWAGAFNFRQPSCNFSKTNQDSGIKASFSSIAKPLANASSRSVSWDYCVLLC